MRIIFSSLCIPGGGILKRHKQEEETVSRAPEVSYWCENGQHGQCRGYIFGVLSGPGPHKLACACTCHEKTKEGKKASA